MHCLPPHCSCSAESKEDEKSDSWELWEALWLGSPALKVWGTSQVLHRGTKINLPWSGRRVWSAVWEQSVWRMHLHFRGPASTSSLGLAVVKLSCPQSPAVWEWVALGPPWYIHFCRNGQPLNTVNFIAAESCLPCVLCCRDENAVCHSAL